jgi:DNA polymerase III sliding clamp (beta) subunit (PCNA family)
METTNLNPITINANALRAAVHCVADKKDLRHYLHGVYVKVKQGKATNSPRAIVAGTNGHILFVGLSEVEAIDGNIGAWFDYSLIIPIDAIKAIDKKAHTVHLSQIDANTYRLGNTVFTPIDGQYPDIARVIPDSEQLAKREQKPAVFNPDYLSRANKAMQTYYGAKPDTTYQLNQYGDDAAIMHAGTNDVQVVVMPIRSNGRVGSDTVQAFNRDYL